MAKAKSTTGLLELTASDLVGTQADRDARREAEQRLYIVLVKKIARREADTDDTLAAEKLAGELGRNLQAEIEAIRTVDGITKRFPEGVAGAGQRAWEKLVAKAEEVRAAHAVWQALERERVVIEHDTRRDSTAETAFQNLTAQYPDLFV